MLNQISLQNDTVLTSIPSGGIFLIDNEFTLNIPDTSSIKWKYDENNNNIQILVDGDPVLSDIEILNNNNIRITNYGTFINPFF